MTSMGGPRDDKHGRAWLWHGWDGPRDDGNVRSARETVMEIAHIACTDSAGKLPRLMESTTTASSAASAL